MGKGCADPFEYCARFGTHRSGKRLEEEEVTALVDPNNDLVCFAQKCAILHSRTFAGMGRFVLDHVPTEYPIRTR